MYFATYVKLEWSTSAVLKLLYCVILVLELVKWKFGSLNLGSGSGVVQVPKLASCILYSLFESLNNALSTSNDLIYLIFFCAWGRAIADRNIESQPVAALPFSPERSGRPTSAKAVLHAQGRRRPDRARLKMTQSTATPSSRYVQPPPDHLIPLNCHLSRTKKKRCCCPVGIGFRAMIEFCCGQTSFAGFAVWRRWHVGVQ